MYDFEITQKNLKLRYENLISCENRALGSYYWIDILFSKVRKHLYIGIGSRVVFILVTRRPCAICVEIKKTGSDVKAVVRRNMISSRRASLRSMRVILSMGRYCAETLGYKLSKKVQNI